MFSGGLFHAESIANAEAKEEEENGAEDGLKWRPYVEPSRQTRNHSRIEKILAETEDIERIGGAEAEGLPR